MRIVFVARACVLFEQVVQQLAGGHALFARECCRAGLLQYRVGDVASRVEGEHFLAQLALGLEQSPDRVVAVVQPPAPAVADAGELAGFVVAVAATDADGGGACRAESRLRVRDLLLEQPPGGVVGLRLGQAVVLLAADFTVEVVALQAQDVLAVEQQAVHVATAVGEPLLGVAVGAGAADSLVEFVVAVLPDGGVPLARSAWCSRVRLPAGS